MQEVDEGVRGDSAIDSGRGHTGDGWLLTNMIKGLLLLIMNSPFFNFIDPASWNKIIGVTLSACGSLVGAYGNLLVQESFNLKLKVNRAKRIAARDTKIKYNQHSNPVNTMIGISSSSSSSSSVSTIAATAPSPPSVSHHHHVSASTHSNIRQLERKSLLYFIIGNLFITVIGTLFTLAAFAFTDQVVLAPLAGLTIVWNVLLMRLPQFGSRSLKKGEDVATLYILLGCAAILVFTPSSDLGTDESLRFSSDEKFLMIMNKLLSMRWLALCFVSLLICMIIMAASTQQLKIFMLATFPSSSSFFSIVDANDVAFGGMLPGLLGGFSNGFAKAAIDMVSLKSELKESDMANLNFIFNTIILALIAICLAGLQLWQLNMALGRWQVANVVPIYQASLIVAGVICGSVFSGTMLPLTNLFVCIAGLSAVIGGVLQLSRVQGSGLDMNPVDHDDESNI